MTNDQAAVVAGWLAATDISLLELSGPDGQWQIRNEGGKTTLTITSTRPALAVSAPHAGVFLTHHPLQRHPVVEPETPVAQGQLVGLLQVGVLLVPVVAPQNGVFVNYSSADRSLVGYATPLFELRPL
jgi:acetyl-CoA carboxylase biotin carboxyl carrier protein